MPAFAALVGLHADDALAGFHLRRLLNGAKGVRMQLNKHQIGRDAKHDARFSGRQLSVHPGRVQFSSGAAADSGFEIERCASTACYRWPKVCTSCRVYSRLGAAADVFCALRAALAAAFTEDGFRTFNQHYVKTLANGACSTVNQSGGAQQRLPGDRSAGRAVLLCVLVLAPEPGNRRDADLRDRRALN